jgi:hypothetical protein
MEDTPFDALARTVGAVTTRRLMVGALLAGALGRLGRGEAKARQGKTKTNGDSHTRGGETKGRDDHTRRGAAMGRGEGAGAEATSGACRPACGACQTCQRGTCRRKNGRKRCSRGRCLAASTGTACTLSSGGSGTCQNGACVPSQVQCSGGLTDCSGGCTNLQTDPVHCGQCGKVCAAQQLCVASACCFPNGTPDVCTADNFLAVCCPGPTGQRGCELPIRGTVGTCRAL